MKNIAIPADVPPKSEQLYLENYTAITKGTDRLMLFAADQKIEHLNRDFFGPTIPQDANDPEHLFKIASQGYIGAFATQLGLIARYGKQYSQINYIAKLNSKTNLVQLDPNSKTLFGKTKKDPISTQLWSLEQIAEINQNEKLKIRGVGYTIYLGSEFEPIMLKQSAEIIYKAHFHGLIAILWIYPRGLNIQNEKDANVIAGATGIANALGADFVKINAPTIGSKTNPELLQQATKAAGNTKVICSGEEKIDEKIFLRKLFEQIHIGKSSGCATGRNIFQRSLKNALAFTKAISAVVYDNKDTTEAIKIYKKEN